jgi:hypothetical protein
MTQQALFEVNDELMVERLAEFLRRNRPSLVDILGAVCEVYKVDPDEIQTGKHIHAPARHAFCYLARRWSGEPDCDIGPYVNFNALGVMRAFKNFHLNLDNPLVRDDLDLIGVKIAERVLLHRRMR